MSKEHSRSHGLWVVGHSKTEVHLLAIVGCAWLRNNEFNIVGTSLNTAEPRKLLEIRELTVRYAPRVGKAVHALRSIQLSVNSGEVIGVIGESGSGKTTLAAAVLRLLPAHAEYVAGSVLFEGRDLLKMRAAELRQTRGARITVVPQNPAIALNPVLKIGTQISEVLRAHTSMTRGERKRKALDLLEEVGFEAPERIYSAYPHELSGGQRQRVVIAQAVACKPALVIADEPTSKLDSQLQAEVLRVMSDVVRRHGAALILITHDPAILIGLADRIVVMYAGGIVEEGLAEKVVREPLHPYTQALLKLFAMEFDISATKVVRLPVIAGDPPDPTQVHDGCRFERRCSERIPVCSAHDPRQCMPQPDHHVSCFKYVD